MKKLLALSAFLLAGCADEGFSPSPEDFDGYWTVAEPYVFMGVDGNGDDYFHDPKGGGTAILETGYSGNRFDWRAANGTSLCAWQGYIDGATLVFDEGTECYSLADDGTMETTIDLGTTAELKSDGTIVMHYYGRWEWDNGDPEAYVEAVTIFIRTDNPNDGIGW